MPDYHWRCECHGAHFLTLSWETGDALSAAELEGYLSLEGDFHASWRDRISQAWRLLRDGCAATRVGVVLDQATALELSQQLDHYLSDMAIAEEKRAAKQ